MKKLILKFKNAVLKILLTFMGFALATSQCLAQYMVITPEQFPRSQFTIKGLTDTISRFMLVIDKQDTVFLQNQPYQQFVVMNSQNTYSDTVFVEISELDNNNQKQYHPFQKWVAVKPMEANQYLRKYLIQMKAKKD